MLTRPELASIETGVPLHLNPNTYWPHVTQPILILSGRYDLGFNAGTSEPRILKTLGSAPDRKKVILYPTAHWPLPSGKLRRDVLAWLAELETVPGG